MRYKIGTASISIWVSARDTEQWANRPGARWPCSTLSGYRFFAAFDRNGLCDITINGHHSWDCDAHEFNAITSDLLAPVLPKDHPCYIVCVGQFKDKE